MPKKPKLSRIPSTGAGDSNVIPLHGGAAPDELRQLIERLNITPDMLPGILNQVGVFGALARPEPLAVPPPPEEVSTYRIRLDLDDARPPIWRRLELAGDLTLDQVHDVLQAAMGWYDGHLHAFRLNPRDRRHFLTDYDLEEGEEGLAEAGVRLDQVLRSVGDRLVYEYDFGDGWEHTLKVEQIRPRGDDLPARCLGGRRAGPPEDIGGIHWYNGVAAALNGEAGAPELDPELLDWLPPDFGPEEFDAESVDRQLRDLVEDGWGPGGMPVLLAEMLARADIEATLILDELMTLAVRPADPADPAGEELSEHTMAAMVRPWSLLLDELGPDGVALTKAGFMPPAVVSALFDGLGLGQEWIGKGNREDLTPPVAELRASAKQLGLVRVHRGRLLATKAGTALSKDPVALWRHLAASLPIGSTDLERQAGMIALLITASGEPFDAGRYRSAAAVLGSIGWRFTGAEPTAADAAAQMSPTTEVLHRSRGLRRPRRFEPARATREGQALARAALGLGTCAT